MHLWMKQIRASLSNLKCMVYVWISFVTTSLRIFLAVYGRLYFLENSDLDIFSIAIKFFGAWYWRLHLHQLVHIYWVLYYLPRKINTKTHMYVETTGIFGTFPTIISWQFYKSLPWFSVYMPAQFSYSSIHFIIVVLEARNSYLNYDLDLEISFQRFRD